MANFDNIKHEIDQNVNTNGQQAITGAILNETLKDMLDDVDTAKQDTLVAGSGISISGNVISATGGSGNYLPLSGGTLQEDAGNDTILEVIDPDSEDYVKIVAPDSGSNPHIEIYENGSGDTKFFYDHIERGSQTSIDLPTNSGTLALTSDIAGKQDALTAGDGIDIDGNDEISVKLGTGLQFNANGEIEATGGGGGSYTAGDGIDISAQDVISAKVDTTQGLNVNPYTGELLVQLGSGLQFDAYGNIQATGGGTSYSAGDGISISNSTIKVNNGKGLTFPSTGWGPKSLQADLGNGLQFDSNNKIAVDTSVVATQSDISGKQDALSSGTNISIAGNVVSTVIQPSFAGVETTTSGIYDTSGSGLVVEGNSGMLNGATVIAHDLETGNTYNSSAQIGAWSPSTQFNDPGLGNLILSQNYNLTGNDTFYEITVKSSGQITTGFKDANGQNGSGTLTLPKATGTLALTSDIPSFSAGSGIDITSGVISVDATDLDGNGLSVDANGALEVDTTVIQEKLTAGTGITINGNTISATGGGGGGLWTSGTGTNSLLAPATSLAGDDALGDGAINAGVPDLDHNVYSAASGDYSAAFGKASRAYGDNSFATTAGEAQGENSFAAIGGDSDGRRSFAVHGDALGEEDLALFGDTKVQQNSGGGGNVAIYGTVWGDSLNVAIGQSSSAGFQGTDLDTGVAGNTISSSMALWGGETCADNSIAIGGTSKGENSVALGKHATTRNEYETGIGLYNKSYASTLDHSVATSFTVGNGSSTGGVPTYSNAIEVKENSDLYVYGVGTFDGTNSSSASTLQDVISGKQDTLVSGTNIKTINNTSLLGSGDITISGGNTYSAGNGISIDQNNEISVDASDLAGSGLQVDANGALEVVGGGGTTYTAGTGIDITSDVISVKPNLTLRGASSGLTIYSQNYEQGVSLTPLVGSGSSLQLEKLSSINAGDTYTVVLNDLGEVKLTWKDSNNQTQTGTINIPQKAGTFALTSDLLSKQNTLVSGINIKTINGNSILGSGDLVISGGGTSYTAGTGLTLNGTTFSADDNYFDGKYVSINGGTILDPGSPLTELNIENGDSFIALDADSGAGTQIIIGQDLSGVYKQLILECDGFTTDGSNYISFPSVSAPDTLALASDLSGKQDTLVSGTNIKTINGTSILGSGDITISGGGGNYLPLTGGTLKDTSVGATETLLDIVAPDTTGAISFSADTLSAMIQMSADKDDASVSDGDTYGVNIDNTGEVDVLVKTVNPSDPTDITTTTYSQTFQQKSGTIALLSDITGSSYTAGTGISISSGTISNTAPDPGLWVAGTGSNAIKTSAGGASASGLESIAIGNSSDAQAGYSMALGYRSKVYGTNLYSIAIGGGQVGTVNSSGYSNSIAIGNGSYILAADSVALGTGTRAFNQGEVSIGYYANSISSGNSSEKTRFTVGNGTGNGSRSNLIEAKQNNDIYVVGVGGFDGTNAGTSGVHTLQYVIANSGGGGSYLPLAGGTLEDASTSTSLVVQAPQAESTANITLEALGTGSSSISLTSESSIATDVEDFEINSNGSFILNYVSGTNDTLTLPKATGTLALHGDLPGNYNYTSADIVYSYGIGTSGTPLNAFAIDANGNIFVKGLGGYTGTDITGCTDLATFLNSL